MSTSTNKTNQVENNKDTSPSEIELLANAYHALSAAINGTPALQDKDEAGSVDYWNGHANMIAEIIAKKPPLSSKDWAHKLSIDLDYIDPTPVLDGMIEDMKRELAA